MKPPSPEDITRQLQQTHFPQKQGRDIAPVLAEDTPLVVNLEQLRPYELNPRVVRNPLYDEIKASIRERGLDQPPAITRRPGEPHFIIRNGGNTRLSILGELWQETREERFFQIHCLFRPWQSESHVLIGHLAESDLHGQLTFIERSLAVAKLKDMMQEPDVLLSQRELSTRLSKGGYPISQSHISRMFDTLEHLLPVIPQVLYAGLGKPTIVRVINLRRRAESIWNQYLGDVPQFALLWFEVLSAFDSDKPELSWSELQDELVARMAVQLKQTPRLLALEMHQETRRSPPPSDAPQPLPQCSPGEVFPQPPAIEDEAETAHRLPAPEPLSSANNTSAAEAPRLPNIREALSEDDTLAARLSNALEVGESSQGSASPLGSVQDDIYALRERCADLAADLAAYADASAMVKPHAEAWVSPWPSNMTSKWARDTPAFNYCSPPCCACRTT